MRLTDNALGSLTHFFGIGEVNRYWQAVRRRPSWPSYIFHSEIRVTISLQCNELTYYITSD